MSEQELKEQLGDELCEYAEVHYPLKVIVKGVLKASPFAGAEGTVLGIVISAQAFAGFGIVCHVSFPPSELS